MLGRPFLKMTRTKIYVHAGNLAMEFDGEVIIFDINDAMRYPRDIFSLYFVDVIEPLTRYFFESTKHELLEISLSKGCNQRSIKGEMKHHPSMPDIDESVDKLDTVQLSKNGKLQIQELEETRNGAYETVKIYKKEVNTFHNKSITPKHFKPGQKVRLYGSQQNFSQ